MESTAVQSAALAGSVSGDLSIWGLFLQADFIVKAVMIALILASFSCWAITLHSANVPLIPARSRAPPATITTLAFASLLQIAGLSMAETLGSNGKF